MCEIHRRVTHEQNPLSNQRNEEYGNVPRSHLPKVTNSSNTRTTRRHRTRDCQRQGARDLTPKPPSRHPGLRRANSTSRHGCPCASGRAHRRLAIPSRRPRRPQVGLRHQHETVDSKSILPPSRVVSKFKPTQHIQLNLLLLLLSSTRRCLRTRLRGRARD